MKTKVDVLKKRMKKRAMISNMIEDILMSPIPPSLEQYVKVAEDMQLFKRNKEWNTNMFALACSVFMKGIQTGDKGVLMLFYEILDRDRARVENIPSGDNAFSSLLSAIREVKALPPASENT